MDMARLVVPVAGCLLALSACASSYSEPVDAHLPSSPTASASAAPEAGWDEVSEGSRPTVPYVSGDRYVTPDGEEQTLPDAATRGVSGVVGFAGGLLVSDTVYFEGANGVVLVRRGERVDSWPSSGRCSSGVPAASADGRSVAWSTVRCPETVDRSLGAIHRASADGTHEERQPIGTGLAGVVGFIEDEVVYNLGFIDGAWITDFRSEPRRVEGIDRVVEVSESGLLIGRNGDNARIVVDTRGTVRWEVAAGDLMAFSPDGSNVLAAQRRRLSVLASADGSPVAGFTVPADVSPWSAVWETDRTLLALMERAGRVAVVRMDLDGRTERVTPAVRLRDPSHPPYVLLSPPPTLG